MRVFGCGPLTSLDFSHDSPLIWAAGVSKSWGNNGVQFLGGKYNITIKCAFRLESFVPSPFLNLDSRFLERARELDGLPMLDRRR
jgi:hypothetical protein